MIGYLKPYFKMMPAKIKTEYRSVYCGLCHALKRKYGYVGVSCLNYEIAVIVILMLAIQEDEKRVYHGSCSITPFLRVPFIDYLSIEFANAAAISILIANYEIMDNLEDEKALKWVIADRLLYKSSQKAQVFLSLNYEQIQYFVQEYYSLERLNKSDFMSFLEASGKMIETLINPVLVNCKQEWSEIILQLANAIGQWVYLIDACDDWFSDKKNKSFNPVNLLSDNTSARSVIKSIELKISECLNILPLKHYADLINYILVENVHNTSNKILDKFERELHLYGS